MPTVPGRSKSTAKSGIALSSSGESHIPSSTRADGSVRREIKVRPGYRPPEDVELYRNRTADAWKNRGSAGVPGAAGLDTTTTAAAAASVASTSAATKNAKRREARKKAAAAAGTLTDGGGVSATTPAAAAAVDEETDGGVSAERQGATADDGVATAAGQARVRARNPGKHDAQASVAGSKSAADLQQGESLSSSSVVVAAATTMTSTVATADERDAADLLDRQKEARKLGKKLRQARELNDRKENGDQLLPEQIEKIIRINDLIVQLQSLGFEAEANDDV